MATKIEPEGPQDSLALDQIQSIIDMINGIMNLVEDAYCNAETKFEMPIEEGGADHLVFALRQAERYEEQEREEARSGI
jgi:hypothetical protein